MSHEIPMKSIPKCKTALKAAVLLAFSLLMPSANAANGLDDDTLALITKLSTNPQLLDETYLSTVLGKPTSVAGQPGAPSNNIGTSRAARALSTN